MRKITSVLLAIILSLAIFCTAVGCGENGKFTVTFDANGGTLVEGSLVQEIQSVEDIVLPQLEREGWTFIGWDTALVEIKESTTVKALWEKNKFTVTFSVSNGTFDEKGGALIQTVAYGKDLVSPVFTREGYTLSWDKDLSTIDADCTVNGVWTAKSYSVNFVDKNGQAIDGVSSITVEYDQTIETLPDLESYTKKFVGWKLASGANLSVGQIYKYDSDITVKAVWTDFASYRISVDLDGGEEMQYPSSYAENATSPTIINQPTKTGYKFKGWVELDENSNPVGAPQEIVQIPVGATGDKTYRATWEVKNYTVKFKTTSGTLDKETMTFSYGQTIENLPTVSDNEGKFICWKYGDNEIKEGESWLFDKDGIEVNAQFIKKYVFTLSTDGLSGETVVPCVNTASQIEVYEMGVLILPNSTPERIDLYKFNCWKYKVGENLFQIASNTTIKDDVFSGMDLTDKLTVEIQLVPVCTVAKYIFEFTLSTSGISGEKTVACKIPDGTETNISLEIGETITIPNATPVDTTEYSFSCWVYRNDGGTLVKVESGTTVTKELFSDLDSKGSAIIKVELRPQCSRNWTPNY